MHKVTEPTSRALFAVMLPTRTLSKIRHWTEFGRQRPTSKEPAGETNAPFAGRLIVVVFNVYIPDEMIAGIFTDINVFNVAKLGELFKHFHVKVFQRLLLLFIRHLVGLQLTGIGSPARTLIKIGK